MQKNRITLFIGMNKNQFSFYGNKFGGFYNDEIYNMVQLDYFGIFI